MGDQRSSHYSFCATGLSLLVDMLQYLRSTPPPELTLYTTLTSVYGSVNTLPMNKMPLFFHFHSHSLYLSYILFFWVDLFFWGSHIGVSHWNSRFLRVFFLFFLFFSKHFYTAGPQTNKPDDFKWGAEEMQSALWAACIQQEHYGLSSGQSNLIAFSTTVKIHVVTVLQHRNTRGYIYDLVRAVNKNKLHNFKGCCFRWCVISLTWLYWYLLTCVQTVLYVKKMNPNF